MKKHFLMLAAVAAILCSNSLNAQEQAKFYKHEIGVSYGIAPAVTFLPLLSPEEILALTLNFNYSYNFSDKHAISAIITYFQSYIRKDAHHDNILFLFIAPEIGYKYTYLNVNNITLYMDVSIGIEYSYSKPSGWFHDKYGNFWGPAYQISPICISVGKQHNLDVGVGVGTQGLWRIGYKYKFNSKN